MKVKINSKEKVFNKIDVIFENLEVKKWGGGGGLRIPKKFVGRQATALLSKQTQPYGSWLEGYKQKNVNAKKTGFPFGKTRKQIEKKD